MNTTLLTGGCVVTMDDAYTVLPRGDVLVEGAHVRAIAASVARPPGARVIDCAGCIVMPGLVQAHVHLCQTLARGRVDDAPLLEWLRGTILPYEAALDAEGAAASAELGCAELLLSGTTAILDMGTVRWQDEIFAACDRAGLRVTSGKAMMDAGDGVPARLREGTRQSLDESVALKKRWHGTAGGRLRYAYAPRFALSCSESLLREVAELAREPGVGMHTHASENRDECAIVREQTGLDNIAYLEKLGLLGPGAVLAHCVWATPAEQAQLARHGAHVAHCPSSNLKLASGIAPVLELRAAGVNVAIGADGAPCNNTLDGFQELRLTALLHRAHGDARAIGARTALELATRGGARALGLDADIGSLAVGKRADVIVVDAMRLPQAPRGTEDPYAMLVYSGCSRDVRDVLVDGRLVVRDRYLLTLDEGQVKARAQAAAARIFRAQP
jgi:cytosine/adenosine deaminase-related metal-dependent hydrolase